MPVAFAEVQVTRDARAVGDGQRRCCEPLHMKMCLKKQLGSDGTGPFSRAQPARGASNLVLQMGKPPEALFDGVSSL